MLRKVRIPRKMSRKRGECDPREIFAKMQYEEDESISQMPNRQGEMEEGVVMSG
jgi:hypothetical protein